MQVPSSWEGFVMKRVIFAAATLLATSAGAQQNGPLTTIVGHPINLHNPIPPTQPINRFKPRNLQPLRTPTNVAYLPGFVYSNPYAQYAVPSEVNVNITNVVPQAGPDIYFVQPQGQMVGGFGMGQLW